MILLDIMAWLDERVDRKADLCLDSRQLRPGDVFFACPGIASDGRAYMETAVAAGVAAIVRQTGGDHPSPAAVPVLEVENLAALLGEIAHLWYGRPSDALTVIAVTGTNGKTSTTQWIAAALNDASWRMTSASNARSSSPRSRNVTAPGSSGGRLRALWIASMIP